MKIKYDRKSFSIACILSLATLVILVIGLATSINNVNAFAATIVVQIGIALLWILGKLGAFKGFFTSTSKMAEKKRNDFRKKHNIKEQQTKSEPLGYIGPLTMLIFGMIEVLIYITYVFI